MKYLCLAYGDASGWKALPKGDQDAVLAHDEALRKRGDLVLALQNSVTTVRAWDGHPSVVSVPFAESRVPLAGFDIIEADNLEEAIKLVTNTPCARAMGAIELRPIIAGN